MKTRISALLDDPKRASGWAAAVAAVVFLPALFNGFAYDDIHIVAENPALRSLGSLLASLDDPYWPGIEGARFGLWRPVGTLGLGLQWLLFGGAPLGFHLVNLVLHALCTFAVVRVGARLVPAPVAVLAGFAFAVHPVHTEAVANVVGFSELLSSVLMLGALLVHLDGIGRPGQARDPGGGRIAALSGLYLLAFLTKENAVVLPALLLGVEAVVHRIGAGEAGRWLRRRLPMVAALAVVGIGVMVVRVAVLGRAAEPTPALGAGLLTDIPRIHTLGEIWWQYLRLSVLPLWLSPDYTPGVVPVSTVWTVRGVAALVAVLGLLVLALVASRRKEPTVFAPALPLGLVWFMVTILPVSNVVFVAGVLVAERTLYLPSVGALWVLAAAVAWWTARRPRSGWAVATLLCLAWTARTVTYTPVWKDTLTVFDHMVRVVPESGRSQWVLGDVLLSAGRVDEAVAAYARAFPTLGAELPFLTSSASRLHGAGASSVARILALRAHDEHPADPAAPQLLSVIAASRRDWPEAVRWARTTVALRPGDPVGLHLLSVGLAEQGQWEEAREARETLLQGGAGSAWQQWYWLTELRARAGDPVAARAAADSARARAPGPEALRQIDSLEVAVLGSGGPL